jgi:deazaflavin-dependent oxidoreductase (nitroreductase family)
MPPRDEHELRAFTFARDQVAEYERSGGRRGNTLRDTGLLIIIVTSIGARTGLIRKTPLLRIEHSGEYALVASYGGTPRNPAWYFNLTASPKSVSIQDGAKPFGVTVREIEGEERSAWVRRAVATYAAYAEYLSNPARNVPILIAQRTASITTTD